MGVMSVLASGPAKRWTALISGGAYAFAAVLVLLLRPWVPPVGVCPGTGLTRAACDLRGGGAAALTAAAVLLLVAAVGASLVVSALAFPLLRLLSGTLVPLGPPGALLLAGRMARKRRLLRLSGQSGDARPASAASVARALGTLRRMPERDDTVLPTRIGNSFAAMSERVRARHGLDVNLCWPTLQQVFDDPARRELEQTSEQVLGRARNLLWSFITVLAAVACAFLDRVDALPAAIAAGAAGAVALILLQGLGNSVDDYADTVEAAVLRHRDPLYRAACWPLPPDTTAERADGATLTAHLGRKDLDPFTVVFERPEPAAEESPQ